MKPLAPQEQKVLSLLSQDFSNIETAATMSISVKTVETYRTRIGHKLGFRTRAALFRYAYDAGMLTADKLVKDVPGYPPEQKRG